MEHFNQTFKEFRKDFKHLGESCVIYQQSLENMAHAMLSEDMNNFHKWCSKAKTILFSPKDEVCSLLSSAAMETCMEWDRIEDRVFEQFTQ